MPKTCRTCKNLIVPEGRRMYRDSVYPCAAPCPDVRALLPASWTIEGPRERFVGPDDGEGCPAYTKLEGKR